MPQSMDVLDTLFGNAAKVRIVRLFLFNPELTFDIGTICGRTKVSQGVVRREIGNLVQTGLIKEKIFFKDTKVQRNRKMVLEKKRISGYMLNYKFASLEQLYGLFSGSHAFKKEDIVSRIGKIMKLDFLVISGFFLQDADSRVDMLIVGENIKEKVLEETIKEIESRIGREIMYAVFTTEEFKYRLSVFDKLIRDILDYPHQILVNKLGI